MSDFRVKVVANLDTKSLEAQLLKLKDKTVKIPIQIDIGNYDFSALSKQLSSAAKAVNIKVTSDGLSKFKSELNSINKQFSNMGFKFTSNGALADIKAVGAQLDRMQRQVLSTSPNASNLASIVSRYEKLYNIQSKLSQQANNGTLRAADVNRYMAAFKTLQNDVKILNNDLSKMSTITERMRFTNQMERWLQANTKATKPAKAAVQSYIDEVNRMGESLTKGNLTQLQNQFSAVNGEMLRGGKLGKSWSDDFGRAFKQITQFASAYGLIQRVLFQVPGQMVQALKDVNAAQIELTKVSDASPSRLAIYWEDAVESAKKYGATVSDVISSTADWSRLGYSIDDAALLSDLTTLYQRVGDNMTQETASESLISTIQGFGLATKDASHIVDAFNEVGNNFAIGSDGIGEALKRSSSAMSAAGNTMEETIGLVTAANTVVQDPDSVGNAFKTNFVFMYRNVHSEHI